MIGALVTGVQTCALPIYADDFVQESLIRALTYVKDGGTIQNWRAYLYRILRNVRADHVGRQARYGPAVVLDDVEHQLAVPAPQPSELLLRELGDAIDKLPSTQRHVVNMEIGRAHV